MIDYKLKISYQLYWYYFKNIIHHFGFDLYGIIWNLKKTVIPKIYLSRINAELI
jgi:hypothetical protein